MVASIWGTPNGTNPAYNPGMWGTANGQQPGGLWGSPAASGASAGSGLTPNLLGIGGSDNTTTTTTTFNPWPQQGENYKYLSAQGKQNYEDLQKQGPVGFDPASTQGLTRMENIAGRPNPLISNAYGAVNDISSGTAGITTGGLFGGIANGPGISAGGFNAMYQNPGVGTDQFRQLYQNNADGPGMLSQGIFGNIARGGQLSVYPQYQPGSGGGAGDGGGAQPFGASADPSLVVAGGGGPGGVWGGNPPQSGGTGQPDPRLNGIPSPQSDPNPYRSAALDNVLSRTMDQIKASASAGGRYGSSAFVDQAARGLGDVASNFNLNAYNSDQDRMMQAAQAASQEQLARQGLGLQAAQGQASAQGQNAATRLASVQGATGIANQNIQNQLAAAQGLTGVQWQNIGNRMQAAGMADALNKARYVDPQMLAQVGGMREAQAKEAQQFGSQNLAQLQGLFGGLPGSAGTSQTSQPSAPWWQQLGGGILSGLGALGGIFG